MTESSQLVRFAQVAGVQDAQRRLAEHDCPPWPEPLAAAVDEVLARFMGLLRHQAIDTCDHLELTRPQPACWVDRWPEDLWCPECGLLRVHALNVFHHSPSHKNGECGRCHRRDRPTRQGTLARGLVLLLIELCEPCLNSEAGPSGEPAAEDLDRRDDEIGSHP